MRLGITVIDNILDKKFLITFDKEPTLFDININYSIESTYCTF